MSDSHDSHETEQGSTAPADAPHAPASHEAAPGPFTAEEANALHADDRVAAGHIVKLMVGIFLGGVVLYSIVDFICARGH